MVQQSQFFFITGYAGSGKDEVGKILQEQGYKRYGFADMVKIHTADKHKFPLELTQSQTGKNTLVISPQSNTTQTVRQFLIDESQFLKNGFNDQAVWAKILERLIKEQNSPDIPLKIVITDWRYPEELSHFQETFPDVPIKTVRIVRTNIIPLNDLSEHSIDHIVCDYTINNDTTLEDLKQQVMQLPI